MKVKRINNKKKKRRTARNTYKSRTTPGVEYDTMVPGGKATPTRIERESLWLKNLKKGTKEWKKMRFRIPIA